MTRSRRERLVLVFPRRQLDAFIASAERLECDLVVVPRTDEVALWNTGLPPSIIGVEAWSGPLDGLDLVYFLERLIEDYGATGIVGLHDAALLAVSSAAESYGLSSLDPEVVAALRSKGAMREVLSQHDMPTPRFVVGLLDTPFVNEALKLPLPLVVKPADGFSSIGVERVERYEDVAPACERALVAMRRAGMLAGEVVIEEYVDGPEYAVESISYEGRTRVLTIGYKGRPSGPYFEESVYRIPSGLTPEAERDIRAVVEQAHVALGIDTGPAHTELRLGRDGKPYILEIGARVGGSGVSHVLVEAAIGIDYFAEVFAVALGRRPSVLDLDRRAPIRAAGNYIVPCGGSGTISEIRGLETVRKDAAVTDVVQMMRAGDRVRPYPEFSGYPAFILSAHDDLDQLITFHQHLDRDVSVRYEEHHDR